LDDAWDKMVEGLGGIAACNNLPQEEQALEHAIMIKKTCKPVSLLLTHLDSTSHIQYLSSVLPSP